MSAVFMDESPQQKAIKNLEIGAGCGDFGKRFFAPCYLTENPATFRPEKCAEGHHIDVFCSATELPWPEGRFENIIMCNPYGYGFLGEESASQLLRELLRVIKPEGKIIIIGSYKNAYCDPKNVKKAVRKMEADFPHVQIRIEKKAIYVARDFDNYDKFSSTEGEKTIPNLMQILYVSK